ncbi:MAG: hypothetical protein ACK5Q5_09020, partial [Planctomycetaceae bacterium]
GHTLEYLGRTTDRTTLYCYYLGQRYADLDVPWHYSFVMFLVTVPVGLHLLGLWGVWGMIRSAWQRLPSNPEASQRASAPGPNVDGALVRVLTQPGSPGDPNDHSGGNGRSDSDPKPLLITGVVLFVLTFFALPGITVYDGERLFLVVFPLWAVLIGMSVQFCGKWSNLMASRSASAPGPDAIAALASPAADVCRLAGHDGGRRAFSGRRIAMAVLLLAGIGEGLWGLIQFKPCHLSYYNLAVGGLSGANRLGFEPTYWRDSFTRDFLEEVAAFVPDGATLYIAPVLHPANRIDLPLLSPLLREHHLQTDSYDDQAPTKQDIRYVLVFRRHADPWDALEPAPTGAKLLCEVRRDGVQLAACYDMQPESQPPKR